MANKYDLQRNISELEHLEQEIHSMIVPLTSASTNVMNIKNTLDMHYTIEKSGGEAGIRSRILSNRISETSNYLKNVVIPSIHNRIKELRNEIHRIEEAERRAREEAERRAREEAKRRERAREEEERRRLEEANRRAREGR